MKPTLKIILALGVSIAATTVFADDNMAPAGQPMSSQQFVWDAGTGGLKEIRLSQLALQKSEDTDVKSFARHMVRDHSAANKKLMKIAEKEGLAFPPTNTFSMWDTNSETGANMEAAPFNSSAGPGTNNLKGAEQLMLATESPTNLDRQTVRSLESLPEPDFDRAYVSEMVKDHAGAVQKFEMASENLSDPDLKKFATKTLPTLREHYQMIQDLQNKRNGMPNAGGQNYHNGNYPNGM